MDIIKNDQAQAVAASTTDQRVSNWARLRDRYSVLVAVRLSAVAEATGITFKLKDSYDGGATAFNVGDQSQATIVKKAFTAGAAEVTNVTLPATSAATQADYLHVTAQDGHLFAIWLDIDAAGTAPTGALYVAADTAIEVNVLGADTAAQVAAKVRTALLANEEWTARFTTSVVTVATFTITQISTGAVDNPAPKSANDGGAGSITISVTTAGSDGDVTLASNQIAESSHGFSTADRVYLAASVDPPAGLASGIYFIISVDANNYKLAETQAKALAGTAVDITDYGSGTNTVYKTDYEIRMIKEDSSDLAQLPLHEHYALFVSSGSSDSCTVEHVFVPEV